MTHSPRQEPLNELDHQVCDEVKRLRADMGLSRPQFARQLGTTERTVSRWEWHHFAPTHRHLARLKLLRDMQNQVTTGEIPVAPLGFSRALLARLNLPRYRRLCPAFVCILLRKLGGEAAIDEAEVDQMLKRKPVCTFDQQAKRYLLRLVEPHPRKETKP